jgi:hypothetical protein
LYEEATHTVLEPADPTDPGDAADLSTPQGFHDGFDRTVAWPQRRFVARFAMENLSPAHEELKQIRYFAGRQFKF